MSNLSVIRTEIKSMEEKLSSSHGLSVSDRQELLDGIKDRKRKIESLSRTEPMVVDVPANKLKDRKASTSSRLSENRCII